MGRPDGKHETKNGTYYVLEKFPDLVMDSSTYGVPVNSPDGYKLKVQWAVRIDNSGAFVHSAPWSVGDQGKRNVSHGCINPRRTTPSGSTTTSAAATRSWSRTPSGSTTARRRRRLAVAAGLTGPRFGAEPGSWRGTARRLQFQIRTRCCGSRYNASSALTSNAS